MRANRLKLSERSKILLLSLWWVSVRVLRLCFAEKHSFIQSFIFPIVNKGGFQLGGARLSRPRHADISSTLYLIKDNISHGVTKVLLAVSKKESV